MMEDVIKLKELFYEIRKKEWILSVNKGLSSVGLTFEKEIGKPVDKLSEPDFGSIEIKTLRNNSAYFRTLFSATPHGEEEYEILRIKDNYGYPFKSMKDVNVFCGDVSAKDKCPIGSRFYFQLYVDRENEKIVLRVYNRNYQLIDDTTYWPFEILRNKLLKKIRYLALVDAKSKYDGFFVYYKYTHLSFFQLKSFEAFLQTIENGKIIVNFTISAFQSGERKGMIHDHGTGFRIHHSNLKSMYDLIDEM